MSHISTAVEYALHSLVYLVDLPDEVVAPSAKDLATLRGLPVKYVAGLMTKLNKAGIIVATEGANGGVRLARPAAQISFFDVVVAIDGRKPIFNCRDVRKSCALFGASPPSWATTGVCGIHAVMLEADARMKDVLKGKTLRDMADVSATRVPAEFKAEARAWLENRTRTRKRRRPDAKEVTTQAAMTETVICQR